MSIEVVSSQLWQVTLLIPVLILVIRLTCRKRSHLAYGLLLVALIKCITPPVFTSPVGVFGWIEGRQVTPQPAAVEVKPAEVADAIVAAEQSVPPPVRGGVEPPASAQATTDAAIATPGPSTICGRRRGPA